MLIGLIGFKQVGKSTASKYLEHRYKFQRHNFKDGLIEHIKQRFPDVLAGLMVLYKMTIDELFDQKPPLMRALMVNVGTDDKRRDDPDHWIKIYTRTLPYGNVVTDDVRFLNEAQVIKNNGGILIRLTRPDLTTGGDHRSETEQLQIVPDYTISCEAGDFEKLYRDIDLIMSLHDTSLRPL